MGEPIPAPVNHGAEIFDKGLKALMDIITSALEAALILNAPFLGAPVIKQIMELGIGWIEGVIYKAIALEGNLIIYTFETALEKNAYQQTVDDLRVAQASNDPLLLTAAEKAFAQAASRLINSDGSSKP